MIELHGEIYTGISYYMKTGSNRWLLRFLVVENTEKLSEVSKHCILHFINYILYFKKYILAKHPNAVEDQIIRFSFLDPVNGYIELNIEHMEQVGWSIEPHMEPLRVNSEYSILRLYNNYYSALMSGGFTIQILIYILENNLFILKYHVLLITILLYLVKCI